MPELPPASAGMKTLLTAPLREAGSTAGSFSAAAGELDVTMFCTDGDLVVHLDPVSTTTIPCPPGVVTPVKDVFHLGSPKDLTVRVEAPPGARWNMRIEQ
ncbi:hypothetical protein [Kitasatospora sp. NPDC088134]|uniref:hypothetical protein n=1 Tax=Kitasatospora sp. NPDC088134 TaxID=3364071 RepID=UPI00381E693C